MSKALQKKQEKVYEENKKASSISSDWMQVKKSSMI
jgi:hypothetical protein